jgi:hypothetical protein
LGEEPSAPINRQMLSALLDILMPERTLERDQETLRLGLIRLQKPLPSDSDPINRQVPDPEPASV